MECFRQRVLGRRDVAEAGGEVGEQAAIGFARGLLDRALHLHAQFVIIICGRTSITP